MIDRRPPAARVALTLLLAAIGGVAIAPGFVPGFAPAPALASSDNTAASPEAAGWSVPTITLPADLGWPRIAVTKTELDRLRDAYAHHARAVIGLVHQADRQITQPLTFPPRGGQHNQWLQCEDCQYPLKYIGDGKFKCPHCGRIYTGSPYIDVWYAHTHSANLHHMTDAAWAYAITGDRKYSDFAAKVLLGYADRYLTYPRHDNMLHTPGGRSGGRLDEQTLGEAADIAVLIGPAFDLIHQSPSLTDADRTAIADKLIRPMLENIDGNKARDSNWQTWHNAAMFIGGAVINDASWMDKAIHQPRDGFTYQLDHDVTSDGMWHENSWGYHFYTLRALTATAEAARRLGIDLYSNPMLERMYTLPARYAMPDGHLPRFGDDVNTAAFGRDELMEPAYAVYHNPALLIGLDKDPTFESILYGRDKSKTSEKDVALDSELFRGAGHAILRPAGKTHLVAAMTFAKFGGFHDHFDKLSFVLYAFGRELGVDPGHARSQAYRLPIHHHWYRATVGHNDVVMDGQSQHACDGELLTFAANNQYAIVGAHVDKAYKGVDHRRWLIATPTCLVVFDDITADADHRFDFWYHNRGDHVDCPAADHPAPDKPDHADDEGIRYVHRQSVGSSDQPIAVAFHDGPVTNHLLLSAAPDTHVMIGDGVGAQVDDRVPVARFTRTGKHVRFAAVLEPTEGDTPPTVTRITTEQTGGATVLTLTAGSDTLKAIINPDGPTLLDLNGKTLLESH